MDCLGFSDHAGRGYYGASGYRPYGYNAYGGYHNGWVHGYWNGHGYPGWGWRNPYWGGWGLGMGLGMGLGWGLSSWGFGAQTGIELPGEDPGKLRALVHWQKTSTESVSQGYELMVTPMQLAR